MQHIIDKAKEFANQKIDKVSWTIVWLTNATWIATINALSDDTNITAHMLTLLVSSAITWVVAGKIVNKANEWKDYWANVAKKFFVKESNSREYSFALGNNAWEDGVEKIYHRHWFSFLQQAKIASKEVSETKTERKIEFSFSEPLWSYSYMAKRTYELTTIPMVDNNWILLWTFHRFKLL